MNDAKFGIFFIIGKYIVACYKILVLIQPCFDSCLRFSLLSMISMNDVLTIQGKRIMDHTQSHASITQHVSTATQAFISS